jgi:DNA adenine methylase
MTEPTKISEKPRPFLKWVGGKRQLLAELEARLVDARPYGRYHEPFVGGGALFFDLYGRKLLGRSKAYLSDNNARLIEAYHGVQHHVEELIALLAKHEVAHDEEHYYAVRAATPDNLVARAARIIYLNRTCYNGLFRENSKGGFNVPMGRYKNPRICDRENLRAVSVALQRCTVEERHFAGILNVAKAGDFVYFDPPYAPISKTANFTGYHKGQFDETSQRELADVFDELTRLGVKAVLSNSDAKLVHQLYKKHRIELVQASRLVNSRADKRGKVNEVIVRNF